VESPNVLVLRSISHPVASIDRVGFPLDHPYVEQCLLPWLGPSSVLFLRRMPELWKDADHAQVPSDELADLLGIKHDQLRRTLDRVDKFGFAKRPGPGQVHVYRRCAPLSTRLLARQPERARDAHHRLVAEHLDQLAHGGDSAAAQIRGLGERVQQRARPAPELGR